MTAKGQRGEEDTSAPHVVIVGGGFGGLQVARGLARAAVRMTVVDRANHHVFQPLLYQVAMAGLSPAEIATPIRSVLSGQANASVLLAEVMSVDLAARRLLLREQAHQERALPFDTLVLAAGTETSYFGKSEWQRQAPGLKDIDDALEMRRRVLVAFEAAEREDDPERRRQLMTFVVIGGGPTGVELAGSLAELARFVLARDFRRINPKSARILLLEGGDRVLTTFPPSLSDSAMRQLESLGVQICLESKVTGITDEGVQVGKDFIASKTVLWAAGVKPGQLAGQVAGQLGAELARGGRIAVGNDCTPAGHPNVFVIGDMAAFQQDGELLPGVAPVAMQQGQFVARAIAKDLANQPRGEFRYKNQGNLATIGRKRAVADFPSMRLSGLAAWLAWLFIHICFLIGFRNRIVVLLNWIWSFLFYQRGARLITGHRLGAGSPQSAPEP